MQKPSSQIKLNPPPAPIITEKEIRSATAEITSSKTNRTLVEFQSKDGTVPEWRVQLKNAVRQRKLQKSPEPIGMGASATALDPSQKEAAFFDSAEIIEEKPAAPLENELLAGALARINKSREKYLIDGKGPTPSVARTVERKPTRIIETETPVRTEKASVNFPPKAVYSPNVDLFDTSELDPDFIPAKVSSSFGRVTVRTSSAPDAAEEHETVAEPKRATPAKTEDEADLETEQMVPYEDDRAPFAYRFNAGLFDVLTASFASMILLAPFMLLGGSWFTVAGLFAFLATSSIVTFIYLTTTIGLFGKSFGMHLFALEMIDAEGEEYPTLHQAAVNSSVFLLSVLFGGAGFITCLFDEEGRAIHDIISNTLVVKEV